MAKKEVYFAKLEDVSDLTGLSMCYLRQGVRNGTIPHIKTGVKYMINVPEFLEDLKKQSRKKKMKLDDFI